MQGTAESVALQIRSLFTKVNDSTGKSLIKEGYLDYS